MSSAAAFEDLGVLPEIIKAVDEEGWTLPTSVQAESIPLILGGGDVMAAAETGTGKTGAFALPAVQLVWEELRAASKERREADDPSLPAATAAKGVRLSMEDCDPGLTVDAATSLAASTCAPGFWAGCRATAGAVGGRYCFEVRVERVADAGVVRVGWSGAAAKLDLGADALGFGYGSVGKKANARQYDTYGEAFGPGDVVLCCLDATAGVISFAKNGADLGKAFAPRPNVCAAGLFPAICLKNAAVSLNFGAAPSAYPLPKGFSMLATPGGDNDGDIIPAPSLASRVRRGGGGWGASDNDGSGPLCLVLEPSRELAEQTHKTFLMLSKYIQRPALRFSLMLGGGNGPQGTGVPMAMRRRGRGEDPHIVTGTPGRLEALVKEGMLSLSNLRLLVLDEADNLAENCPDAILRFYKAAPKARLQVLMFSATLHSDKVRALSEKICCFPTWVDLKGADFIPYTVDHAFYVVNPRDDAKLLRASPVRMDTDKVHLRTDTSEDRASEFVKVVKPHVLLRVIAAHEMNQAIIFCRTKLDCDNLEAFLERSLACDKRAAFPAGNDVSSGPSPSPSHPQFISLSVVLHSDKTQEERARNLERFKKGLARFLITTDVAARGIDIGEVPYVINYTLPSSVEDYIHRAGRVGRAETMGLAISLVGGAKERVWFHRCPLRGKGCTNRQLVSDGGCTLWYDEKALWSAISLKISNAQGSLVRLTAAGGYRVPGDLGVYGRRAVGKGKASAHAAALKSKAEQVAELDGIAQMSYWSLYQFKRKKK